MFILTALIHNLFGMFSVINWYIVAFWVFYLFDICSILMSGIFGWLLFCYCCCWINQCEDNEFSRYLQSTLSDKNQSKCWFSRTNLSILAVGQILSSKSNIRNNIRLLCRNIYFSKLKKENQIDWLDSMWNRSGNIEMFITYFYRKIVQTITYVLCNYLLS